MESANEQPSKIQASSSTPSAAAEQNSTRRISSKKRNLGVCNQEILKLVSRGSAIICEILRLKDFIPEVYYNPNEEKMYKDIIFDYSIFNGNNFEKFEKKLQLDQ